MPNFSNLNQNFGSCAQVLQVAALLHWQFGFCFDFPKLHRKLEYVVEELWAILRIWKSESSKWKQRVYPCRKAELDDKQSTRQTHAHLCTFDISIELQSNIYMHLKKRAWLQNSDLLLNGWHCGCRLHGMQFSADHVVPLRHLALQPSLNASRRFGGKGGWRGAVLLDAVLQWTRHRCSALLRFRTFAHSGKMHNT